MSSQNIASEKEILRSRMRRILSRIKADDRQLQGKGVTPLVLNNSHFQQAQNILCYVSLPDELQTFDILRSALAAHKNVYVPRIDSQHGVIRCVQILNLEDDLVPGKYGVPEPKVSLASSGVEELLDLVVVPGLAFDKRGHRLGRGMGFFDRFLSRCTGAYTLGICLDQQVLENIPVEKHDVPLDEVLAISL